MAYDHVVKDQTPKGLSDNLAYFVFPHKVPVWLLYFYPMNIPPKQPMGKYLVLLCRTRNLRLEENIADEDKIFTTE